MSDESPRMIFYNDVFLCPTGDLKWRDYFVNESNQTSEDITFISEVTIEFYSWDTHWGAGATRPIRSWSHLWRLFLCLDQMEIRNSHIMTNLDFFPPNSLISVIQQALLLESTMPQQTTEAERDEEAQSISCGFSTLLIHQYYSRSHYILSFGTFHPKNYPESLPDPHKAA